MQRNNYLLRKYGITNDQYEALLVGQRECCGICGRHAGSFQKRLATDHDHETGEVRGILCTHCNRYVLGRYRRKDIPLIKNLLKYLEGEYTGFIVPPKKKKKKRGRKKKTKALLRKQK